MGVSLRDKASTAAAISRGELNVRPTLLSAEDELGLAFIAMVENLQGTVANLRSGSVIMSDVAATVSFGAEQVVGAANETAAATSQLATTVDELRQTTEQTALQIRNVSDRAEASADAAQQGQAAVLDAASSMYEVRSRMTVLAERTAQLTEKSLAIGEIVSVVNELAEQSAILSVNASIEAAHANEHGEGFSIVASEMRSLASQSKQAVLKVRAILVEVQRLIVSLVEAAEQSGLAVTHGVSRSEVAGSALSRMAEIVEAYLETAKEVKAQAVKQSAGIMQVAAAIHQIKVAASDNLLSMQNVKLATRELELASRSLQGQIAAFKS
jgi:methyl-accepting chemotaxis protein